jgi:pimeloyl-ACP methyl ester carboxylesterase
MHAEVFTIQQAIELAARSLVSTIVLWFVLAILAPTGATAQVWTVIAADPMADGRDPSLPDVAQVAYRYDKQQDLLWFRVSLYGKLNEQQFGVNLVFDTGANDAARMNWWGANTAFKFDKLVTAWVTAGANGYQGTIGVGDVAGAQLKRVNNLLQNNLQIRVEGDSILIGVKRSDVTDKTKMNLIVAVGSDKVWNDDVPNTGFGTIDLSAERPKRGLREIDLSRNNLELAAGYKLLADDHAPVITKKGQGPQAVILVPGLYSGAKSFDGFIERNQSRYRMYVVTPPGLNGTPSRSMPARGASFGELTWTRRLEQDLLDLIRREKLSSPVLVADSYPGSTAAVELAIEHPDQVAGVVIAGNHLMQSFYSPKDPTRKTSATFQERVAIVDEGFGAKWFKYVTPETWESNDIRAEMLSADPQTGEQARKEIEEAPLSIKIRYLCEFWASDVTRGFDRLQVPVLALIPGFDDKFLSDPANGYIKSVYIDSWETVVPKHPKLELMKIPGARLLVFQDQPQLADEAITRFFERLSKVKI